MRATSRDAPRDGRRPTNDQLYRSGVGFRSNTPRRRLSLDRQNRFAPGRSHYQHPSAILTVVAKLRRLHDQIEKHIRRPLSCGCSRMRSQRRTLSRKRRSRRQRAHRSEKTTRSFDEPVTAFQLWHFSTIAQCELAHPKRLHAEGELS